MEERARFTVCTKIKIKMCLNWYFRFSSFVLRIKSQEIVGMSSDDTLTLSDCVTNSNMPIHMSPITFPGNDGWVTILTRYFWKNA